MTKISHEMMNNVITKYGTESKQAIAFCRECAKRPKAPEKSVFVRAMYRRLIEGSQMEDEEPKEKVYTIVDTSTGEVVHENIIALIANRLRDNYYYKTKFGLEGGVDAAITEDVCILTALGITRDEIHNFKQEGRNRALKEINQ